MPTLNSEKDNELFNIILKLHDNFKSLDLGIPLQEFYRQVKAKGLYQSDRFIAEKLKKFEQMGLIRIENWNIVEVRSD